MFDTIGVRQKINNRGDEYPPCNTQCFISNTGEIQSLILVNTEICIIGSELYRQIEEGFFFTSFSIMIREWRRESKAFWTSTKAYYNGRLVDLAVYKEFRDKMCSKTQSMPHRNVFWIRVSTIYFQLGKMFQTGGKDTVK